MTKDCRAGTSIELRIMRTSSSESAIGAEGMIPATISNRFAGRCVKTIVLINPKRAASREESSCESAAKRPATKKNAAVAGTLRLKRWKSQSASSDCTTKPPPAESMEKSAARRSTMARDFASGLFACAYCDSTRGESPR